MEPADADTKDSRDPVAAGDRTLTKTDPSENTDQAIRFRRVPDVEAPLLVVLEDWRIFELPGRLRLLSGWLNNKQTLRVTSPIVWFSAGRRKIITSSGRCYLLLGAPIEDHEIVMLMACCVLAPCSDVTAVYWEAIQASH